MANTGTNYAPHCPKLPWMVDFYSTGGGKVPNFQQKAAFAENYMEYATSLNIESTLFPKRLTGIICSIGPKSNTVETLEKMMEEGMAIVRIKSASYSQDECKSMIANIRKASDDYSRKLGRVYSVAIALDIQGPEIRTGDLKNSDIEEIELVQGNVVDITSDISYEEHVTEEMIYVNYQQIEQIVEPGDRLHFNEGDISVSAQEIVGNIIKCIIEKTGKLISKASVSLEGAPVQLPPISEKDSKDILFCVTENLDFVFLSCVKDKFMVQNARKILGEEGKSILIIAKIENGQGYSNIDDIIAEADGILISRGKLSFDLPQEKLFIIQKNIIAKCNKVGKPVICAPKMLDSMTTNPRPTKAEIIDISNAVLEGADCLLLTRETTHGDYPLECIRTLSAICREAEAAIYQRQMQQPGRDMIVSPVEPIYALAHGVVEAAMKCNAAAIVMTTTTGRAAQIISRFRPRCPIVAVTRFGAIARQLTLFRGIDPVHYINPPKSDWLKDVEKRIQFGITYGKLSGFILPGDCVLAARSSRPGAGFVNSMQIYYASEYDAVPRDVHF